jgi:hypothetical protein
MKKFVLFTLSLVLSATMAQAACEVAVMVNDPSAQEEFTGALVSKLQKVLKKIDKTNVASEVQNVYTTKAQYLYFLNPTFNGFAVGLGIVGTPVVVYGNAYNALHFRSEAHVITTLAADFEKSVLPLLTRCPVQEKK